jgi:hypothetical protein
MLNDMLLKNLSMRGRIAMYKNKRKIILTLTVFTLLVVFSSLVFAQDDMKPQVYVEQECVCIPVPGGYDCCMMEYRYDNSGDLISSRTLWCKFTGSYGDC